MDAKALNAAMAYTDALKRPTAGGMAGGDEVGAKAGAMSFSDLLMDAAEGAVNASRQSEVVSVQAAAKQAELVDVITAVTNAELALESVVAVRDKVVQAYQTIMRMPI
jgi:flagellar hook-basal body complex protein FliE